MSLVFIVPVEVVSEANRRDHWAVKARRANNQKGLAYAHCLAHMGRKPRGAADSYAITLTRVMGKRQRPFDGDNLQRALKAVRDGIAMYLGIDDGSWRLDWRYAQEKGRAAEVRVEIREMRK